MFLLLAGGGGGLALFAPVFIYRKFCRAKNCPFPGVAENEDVPEEPDVFGTTATRFIGVLSASIAFLTAHATNDFADARAVTRALEGHAGMYAACAALSANCLRNEKRVCPKSLNALDAAAALAIAGLCAAAAGEGPGGCCGASAPEAVAPEAAAAATSDAK